jgi:hypothetical protein
MDAPLSTGNVQERPKGKGYQPLLIRFYSLSRYQERLFVLKLKRVAYAFWLRQVPDVCRRGFVAGIPQPQPGGTWRAQDSEETILPFRPAEAGEIASRPDCL